jgi:NitT/TauT family transport system substrate-binding protein
MDTDAIEQQAATTETPDQPALARRELLRRAGIGAGALALGGVVTAAPALAHGAFAVVKSRPKVTLGYFGVPCEAPLFTAYQKGFFAAEGLDATLFAMTGGYNNINGLSTGAHDAEQGAAHSYLPAIEQGAAIDLAGGLHGNCLRLLVGAHAGIKTVADFKGKTIGVVGSGDLAMSFFEILLVKNGVDPRRDITWKVLDPSKFGAALDSGTIQAVATFDPFGYLLIMEGKAIQAGSNLSGLFGSTTGLTPNRYCCNVVLSGKLVRDQPKVAAAVTRAWLKASHYIATHTHEAAKIETGKGYVALPQATAEAMLKTFRWNPSATLVKQDILATARNMKQAGLLATNTNPDMLAQVAYTNVFALAGESVPSF